MNVSTLYYDCIASYVRCFRGKVNIKIQAETITDLLEIKG